MNGILGESEYKSRGKTVSESFNSCPTLALFNCIPSSVAKSNLHLGSVALPPAKVSFGSGPLVLLWNSILGVE